MVCTSPSFVHETKVFVNFSSSSYFARYRLYNDIMQNDMEDDACSKRECQKKTRNLKKIMICNKRWYAKKKETLVHHYKALVP